MSVRRAASVPAAPVAASSCRLRDVLAAGLGTASASNMHIQEAISTTMFNDLGELNKYLLVNLQYIGNGFGMRPGEEGVDVHFEERIVLLGNTFEFDANGIKCLLVYTKDEYGNNVFKLQHTALHRSYY